MSLSFIIKKNIEKMNYDLRDNRKYWKTSAGNIIFLAYLNKLLPLYCKGKILDAGAGHLLYKNILTKYSNDYESMDFNQTHHALTYIADIQNMNIIKSNRYDFVFSRNVLEHVINPSKGISEIARVLKNGGHAIITVPHLGYLHNEPYDYWRFTKYSLEKIAKEKNLEVVSIIEIGGFMSFCGYIFQTIFLGLTYKIIIANKICFWINFIIQKIIVFFDKFFGFKKFLPLNYIIIVKKN